MWSRVIAAVALGLELFSRDEMFTGRWPLAMKVVGIVSVCLALLVDRSKLVLGAPKIPGGPVAVAVAALAALLGAGCPGCQGEPGSISARVADCGKGSVRQNWPKVLPAVNDCLVSGSAVACLLGLVQPAVGITESVIACVVRSRATEFAAMASANPEDSTAGRAARNAEEFIRQRGWTFASDAP